MEGLLFGSAAKEAKEGILLKFLQKASSKRGGEGILLESLLKAFSKDLEGSGWREGSEAKAILLEGLQKAFQKPFEKGFMDSFSG